MESEPHEKKKVLGNYLKKKKNFGIFDFLLHPIIGENEKAAHARGN